MRSPLTSGPVRVAPSLRGPTLHATLYVAPLLHTSMHLPLPARTAHTTPRPSRAQSIPCRGMAAVQSAGRDASAPTDPAAFQLPPGVSSIPDHLKPLFTPLQLSKQLQLSNRMVYAPLTRCRAVNNITPPETALYYSQRAYPGSLMLSEATATTKLGRGFPNTPGLWSQEQVNAWKPVVSAVKAKGGVFFAQIWHAGRASHPAFLEPGSQPVSSSPLAISSEAYREVWTGSKFELYQVPKVLDREGIKAAVAEYATAAKNALAAGFDGVEIHAANGYLIDQFTKSSCNTRTDEYGGSIENRCRFALEVVQAVVDAVGAERVGIRFSPFAGFLDAVDATPYATYSYLAEQLNRFGLCYLHMVEDRIAGDHDQEQKETGSLEPFRKVFKGPFIVAGGYKRDSGAAAVAAGSADLVAFGRLWLANPDLPKRFLLDAPLTRANRATFYTPDLVVGYTDYPFLE